MVLARTLARAWGGDASALHGALREYEGARMARAAPLVQRAYYMGAALGLSFWPVRRWASCPTQCTCVAQVIPVREFVMSKIYSPRTYLLHTTFDCGDVQMATAILPSEIAGQKL